MVEKKKIHIAHLLPSGFSPAGVCHKEDNSHEGSTAGLRRPGHTAGQAGRGPSEGTINGAPPEHGYAGEADGRGDVETAHDAGGKAGQEEAPYKSNGKECKIIKP